MSKFVMYADDLLSKWGFGDGDRLGEFIYEEMNVYDFEYNEHKLLEELVKRYLLPKLDKKVEIYFISTIHNPVRAEYIDGEPYENHYNHDGDGLLGDVRVELDMDTIRKHMEDFGYKPKTTNK